MRANGAAHRQGEVSSSCFEDSEWPRRKKCNRADYIRYYSALLVPWYPGSNPASDLSFLGPAQENLTTPAFINVLQEYSLSNSPALHRARFYLYNNITMNMNAPKAVRFGSQIWRSRAADHWAMMNPADVLVPAQPAGDGGGGEFNPDELVAAIAMFEAIGLEVNAVVEPPYMKERSACYEGLNHKISAMLPVISTTSSAYSNTKRMPALYPKSSDWGSYQTVDWQNIVLDKIGGEREIPLFESSTRAHSSASPDDQTAQSPAPLDDRPLKSGQHESVDLFCDKIFSGEQALLLVTGSPGTGKSFTAETAEGRLYSSGLGCFGISFMWSAVGNTTV